MRKSIVILLCCLFALTGCKAAMEKALLGKSRSQAATALSGMQRSAAYPLYYGTYTAPNTMIFYHNPQCPYSANIWPVVRAFAEQQSPADFKLVVLGSGFDLAGTWLLQYGAIVAEQNPALARDYMSAVCASRQNIPANSGLWTSAWQKQQSKAALDPERANALVRDDDFDVYFAQGRAEVSKKYGVRSTPSFVINGRVYKGDRSVAGFTAFMKKRKAYPALP